MDEQGIPRLAQTQKGAYRNGSMDRWSVMSVERLSKIRKAKGKLKP